MSCPDAARWSQWLDGEAPDPAHRCPNCEDTLGRLRAVSQALELAMNRSEGTFDRQLTAAWLEKLPAGSRPSLWWGQVVLVAGVLLVMAAKGSQGPWEISWDPAGTLALERALAWLFPLGRGLAHAAEAVVLLWPLALAYLLSGGALGLWLSRRTSLLSGGEA